MAKPLFCAIGDVHGEFDRLKDLHAQVLAHARRAYPGRPLQLVHLGDLVDRGPASAQVVEYLMTLELPGWPAPVTLRGNHEQMMIDALDARERTSPEWDQWLWNGGRMTLDSYASVPGARLAEHLAWLKSLPTLHVAPEAGLVFVHGGIDPAMFPRCGEQVHMWTRRQAFFEPGQWTAPALRGMRVIHGHTPTRDSFPETAGAGQRLNIDTGAVYGGRLTAAFLEPGAADIFLYA
ncbi:MAG: metallophosphoesterase [Hyphomonas sp.]|jgi:serine/threonine protein phosphatase 1